MCKYTGVGGWAAGSDSPPCGWPMAILGTVAVVSVLVGVALIGTAAGLN